MAATNQVQWFGIRFSNIGFPKEFFLPALNAGGLDTTANEVQIHRRSSKGDYVDIWLQSNSKRKAVDRALTGFAGTLDSNRSLWVKLLSHQPANLPLRNNEEKQTCRRRIAEKLTSLTQDWQAQRVQNRPSSTHSPRPSSVPDDNEIGEQNNEAEQASNPMSQEHADFPGEGNAAEEQVLCAGERHETSYSGPLVPYSDSESGDSVADSPRTEPVNSAVSSEPSESEDSPLDATSQEEQTHRPALRRKRENTESSLGSDAEYLATQGDPNTTQGDPAPPLGNASPPPKRRSGRTPKRVFRDDMVAWGDVTNSSSVEQASSSLELSPKRSPSIEL